MVMWVCSSISEIQAVHLTQRPSPQMLTSSHAAHIAVGNSWELQGVFKPDQIHDAALVSTAPTDRDPVTLDRLPACLLWVLQPHQGVSYLVSQRAVSEITYILFRRRRGRCQKVTGEASRLQRFITQRGRAGAGTRVSTVRATLGDQRS